MQHGAAHVCIVVVEHMSGLTIGERRSQYTEPRVRRRPLPRLPAGLRQHAVELVQRGMTTAREHAS